MTTQVDPNRADKHTKRGSKSTNTKSLTYATLTCRDCKASWDISFENMSFPPSEYAMAIEQKASEGCPDCSGTLEVNTAAKKSRKEA